MFKSIEELNAMSLKEIAAYVTVIEKKIYDGEYTADDEVPFINWCGDELVTVLEEKIGEDFEEKWDEILENAAKN